MPRNFNTSKRFVFTIIICLFALSSGELLLRAIGYTYSPMKVEFIGNKKDGLLRTDHRKHHIRYDNDYIFDSMLMWTPKKNHSPYNEQGFQGPVLKNKKMENEYRIFAIGDSNTEGRPLAIGGWSKYLGNFFQTKYKNNTISVINAGVSGYTAYQALVLVKKVLKYKPDMMFVSVGSNDAHRVTVTDKEYVNNITPGSFYLSNLRSFQLFIAVKDMMLLKNKKEVPLVPRVSLPEFKNYIKEIIAISLENDIKLVLLTRPFIGESPHKLWWKNFGPQYNKAITEIGKAESIQVLDIYSYFENKADYYTDESHFTEEGHEIAAEFIYSHVEHYVVKELGLHLAEVLPT